MNSKKIQYKNRYYVLKCSLILSQYSGQNIGKDIHILCKRKDSKWAEICGHTLTPRNYCNKFIVPTFEHRPSVSSRRPQEGQKVFQTDLLAGRCLSSPVNRSLSHSLPLQPQQHYCPHTQCHPAACQAVPGVHNQQPKTATNTTNNCCKYKQQMQKYNQQILNTKYIIVSRQYVIKIRCQ